MRSVLSAWSTEQLRYFLIWFFKTKERAVDAVHRRPDKELSRNDNNELNQFMTSPKLSQNSIQTQVILLQLLIDQQVILT